MPEYMIAAICSVAVSSIIMLLVFCRLKLLSFKTVGSITLASLITAIAMPGVFSLLSSYNNGGMHSSSVILIITLASFVIYILLVFILSILISYITPKFKTGRNTEQQDAEKSLEESGTVSDKTEVLPQQHIEAVSSEADAVTADMDSKPETSAAGLIPEADSILETESVTEAKAVPEAMAAEMQAAESVPDGIVSESGLTGSVDEEAEHASESVKITQEHTEAEEDISKKTDAAGNNYLEQIYINYVGRNDEETNMMANNVENADAVENNDEKSVDSKENIDKMGIENSINGSDTLSVEECVEEAFRLKEMGDFEGSIIYFMYALDKEPQKELTFWIVLDICVMYKVLGQRDLALEILESYYDIYSDVMDKSVKDEIAGNLTDIQT